MFTDVMFESEKCGKTEKYCSSVLSENIYDSP